MRDHIFVAALIGAKGVGSGRCKPLCVLDKGGCGFTGHSSALFVTASALALSARLPIICTFDFTPMCMESDSLPCKNIWAVMGGVCLKNIVYKE